MDKTKLTPLNWDSSLRDFYYLNEVNLPQICLAVKYDADHDAPSFKEPKKWYKMFHQTSGYACHHEYFYAYFLDFKNSKIQKSVSEFTKSLVGCCISNYSYLQPVLDYQKFVNESFGGILTIENTFRSTSEAYYPFDLNTESLSFLSKNKIQVNSGSFNQCEDLFVKPKGKRVFHFTPKIQLVILGENCD